MNLFDLYAKIIFDSSDYEKGVSGATKKTQPLTEKLSGATIASETLNNKIKVLSAQYESARKNVDTLTTAFNKSAKENGAAADETQELAKELNKAENEAEKLKKQLDAYSGSVEKASESTEPLKNKLDAYSGSVKKASESTESFSQKLKQGFLSASKVAVAGITAVGTAITVLGKIGLDYNMQMESYEANFSTLLGSFDAGKQKVAELADFAAKTPFEMTDLASATQTLLSFGIASENTSNIMKMLGDVSLGNSQKFQSLATVFGQVSSAGKLTGQDLNQMINAGFNPLQVISEKTGESMASLRERMSEGKIGIEEVTQAFRWATEEGGMFFNGMEVGAQTTQGLISTLKDNVTALIGKVFTPLSEGLSKKVLPAAINAVAELTIAYEEKGIEGMMTAGESIIGTAIGYFVNSLPQFVSTAGQFLEAMLQGINGNIPSIVQGGIEVVLALIETVVGLLPDIVSLGLNIIIQLAIGALSALPRIVALGPEIFNGIVQGIENVSQSIVDQGDVIVEYLKSGLSSAWAGLKSWWEGLWNSVFGNLTANVTVNKTVTTTTGTRGGDARGSHAGGLDYVPYDGYIAELHRGEMVLTRSESERLKNNNSGVNFGDVNIYINGANYDDEESLAETVAEKLRQMIDGKGAVYA